MKVLLSVFSFFLFFSSCTIKAPSFTLRGVQTEEALSFLEEYQNGEKKEESFDKYLHQLRGNYAAGFKWDQYWIEIAEKKLYKSLEEKELNQLLSLNEISCEHKNWSAFSKLLLQIAKSNSEHLLFSQYLTDLQSICFTWLPNPDFKAILSFLSHKRNELEAEQISKERQAFLKNREENSNLAQKSEKQPKKYIYTEELLKILLDEKSRKHTARNWDSVLEAVDRDFWRDARWISYQSKNRDHLRELLELEWKTYENIKHELFLDIFLMFEENKKMEDIIKLGNYEKYFSDRKSLNWSVLWEELLVQYPVKPKNGNTGTLLSLYKYSTCQNKEISAFVHLTDQWEETFYKREALDFCEEYTLKLIGHEGIQAILERLYSKVFQKVTKEIEQEILEKANKSLYQNLNETLEVSTQTIKNPEEAVSDSRSIKEIIELISTYDKEQYNHSKEQWKSLLDKHFSEKDWLFTMKTFRNRKDSLNLSKILDMHHFIYDGNISFLNEDIYTILREGEVSLADISDKYGYREPYVNSAEVRHRFWEDIKNSIDQPEAVDWTAFETDTCSHSYIKQLFLFFSKYNRQDMLIDQFYFKDCSVFIREFKNKEWDRLAQIVNAQHLEGSLEPSFVWWLASVLSLYSGKTDFSLEGVVSKISSSGWNNIMTSLLNFYISKSDRLDNDLFDETLNKVRLVYDQEMEATLCSFLSKEEGSLFVQKYEPKQLINLLDGFSWSKKQIGVRRRTKNISYCKDFLSKQKRNTLLYDLSQSLFKQADGTEDLSEIKDIVLDIWSVAVQIMDLSIKMNDLEDNGIWKLSFTLFNSREEMDDYDFYIQFSNKILEQLLIVVNGDKDLLLDYLTNYVWKEPPKSSYHKIYRDGIKDILESTEGSFPAEEERPIPPF